MNINLVRDKATGRSRGFAFLCYEDQKSTILAVDNLNGIKVSLMIICIFYFSIAFSFNVLGICKYEFQKIPKL